MNHKADSIIPVTAFLLFWINLATVSHSSAQFFLRGSVLDKTTSSPIAYANISVRQSLGTASNEQGEFMIKIPSEYVDSKITVSCIGYSKMVFAVDSLMKSESSDAKIFLTPYVTVLDEMKVYAAKASPADFVKDAISEIPKNYVQFPFNMEFYSILTVNDKSKTYYTLESIVDTYRLGYVPGAENASKMLQKRVSGSSPIGILTDKKRNVSYFSYEMVPLFDIFLVDMIGVGTKYGYTVFNPDYFPKLTFEDSGTTIFEGDIVSVVNYWPKGPKPKKDDKNSREGTLYISLKDLGILRHTRKIGTLNFEVSYRKWGEGYFPYFVKSVYPLTEKGKNFEVIMEAFIKNISMTNVRVYKREDLKNWHLEDVVYDANYWEANHPKRK